MICSVPFGPLASWLLDVRGLRQAVLLGALFNALGAWVRYVGDFSSSRLVFLFIGQILSAMAQPVILDCPTMLAATWFGENERATANMIASIANPVGVALGSFFPPIIVDNPDTDMRMMLLYFSFPATAGLILSFFLLQNRPPTPPSASATHDSHDSFLVACVNESHARMACARLLAIGRICCS